MQAGLVRKHELRGRFRPVFPGVYLPASATPTFRQRAEAAWLWSHRDGVLAGLTAARLHGAKWVGDLSAIELIWSNRRPPAGIRVFSDRIGDDEREVRVGLPVTTVVRTAYDLGRRGRFGEAVARLDALGNATAFDPAAVAALADANRGGRGVRRLRRALDVHDPGAQSPKETWLRLLVIGAGFPAPRTQIPVLIGDRARYYVDMGWEEQKIAVEYDGDHHRTDRSQFARDIDRLADLADLGWTVIRVAADTARAQFIARLRRAWDAAESAHRS